MRTFEITIESQGPMLWGRQIDDSERPETTNKGEWEQSRWRERMLTDEDGTPMLPRLAINNCLTEAAKALRKTIPGKGKSEYGAVFARALVPPNSDVRLDVALQDVKPITMFVPSDGKKGGGKRVNRIFAQIDNWKATFQVVALDNCINKEVLELVANYASMCVGFGAMRPGNKNCGQCGSLIGRPLRFDARIPGFVCEGCATRDAYIVSNEVADELDAIGKLPVSEYAARRISSETLFEVRSLAGTIRRHFLGHELKSFEVLASVISG